MKPTAEAPHSWTLRYNLVAKDTARFDILERVEEHVLTAPVVYDLIFSKAPFTVFVASFHKELNRLSIGLSGAVTVTVTFPVESIETEIVGSCCACTFGAIREYPPKGLLADESVASSRTIAIVLTSFIVTVFIFFS